MADAGKVWVFYIYSFSCDVLAHPLSSPSSSSLFFFCCFFVAFLFAIVFLQTFLFPRCFLFRIVWMILVILPQCGLGFRVLMRARGLQLTARSVRTTFIRVRVKPAQQAASILHRVWGLPPRKGEAVKQGHKGNPGRETFEDLPSHNCFSLAKKVEGKLRHGAVCGFCYPLSVLQAMV